MVATIPKTIQTRPNRQQRLGKVPPSAKSLAMPITGSLCRSASRGLVLSRRDSETRRGRHGGRPPSSWLASVGNLHHLHFLAMAVCPVHVKGLGLVVHDLPYGAMRHPAATWFRIRAFQRDGLAVGTRRAFHHEDPRAHRIHPGRHVLLGHVVIGVDADSREGLPHHLGVVFLVEKTPVQQHLHLGGAGRFRRRLARLHPFFSLGYPTTGQAREQLMRCAGRAQFLPHFHHRLLIHLSRLLFLGDGKRCSHNQAQTGEQDVSESHGILLYVVIRLLAEVVPEPFLLTFSFSRLGADQDLETAVDHALDVEGHVLRITHIPYAWIFHYLGIDAIAMRSRLIHDIREHDRFAGLEFDRAREWHPHLHLEIVAGALLVVESAILPPDFSRLL